MSMNRFSEFKDAVRQAELDLACADSLSTDMARMIAGRLRKVSPYWLRRLKYELRDFNIQTCKWKGGGE
jgi:hypothetical protein